MERQRPGPKPRGPFEDKRRALATRVTDDTRDKLDAAAAASGRSLSQEIELRLELSFDRQSALSEAFELAYGDRVGLVRFLGEIIRRGGGSRALSRALQRLAVPDLTQRPDDLADRIVFDAGYAGSDDVRAAEGAKWRERLGPGLAPLLIAAYHQLRDELEREPREPIPPDPEIAATWDAALAPYRRGG